MSFNPSAPYDHSHVPIPTTKAPPKQGSVLRRAKTLTRPERGVAQAPLINPSAPPLPNVPGLPGANKPPTSPAQNSRWEAWSVFAHVVTFWAPPFLLALGGLKDQPTRQAWREKVALCFIALVLGGAVGFGTMGLDRVLCSGSSSISENEFIDFDSGSSTLGVQGIQFDISNSLPTTGAAFYDLAAAVSGQDITPLFYRNPNTEFPSCRGLTFRAATLEGCCDPTDATCSDRCPLEALNNATLAKYQLVATPKKVGYDWHQVSRLKNYLVIDGAVLNLKPYVDEVESALRNDAVDAALRSLLKNARGGKDGTRLFYNRNNLKGAVPCLKERYYAGNIDKIPPGCFVSQLFLYSSMIIIMGLVLVRFVMACIFSWFMSARLVEPPKDLHKNAISPAVMPGGANVAVDSKHGEAPWAKNKRLNKIAPPPRSARSATASFVSNDSGPSPLISMAQIGAELFCVCLVTCYSEGEEGIKGTLDSISQTTYSDSRKLIFIVADGMITGAGESRSTPDICVGLLDADPRFGNPTPMGYIAVGLGAKAENRAMVYAGHYTVGGHRTPTIIVVKCGTEAEMNDPKSKAKAGNRGKRDSQLILMNFFSRVTYNDRMTPLDFDMFRKVQVLMGVTPDFFEVTLMVDADTRVMKNSITQLVNCLHHDKLIMGVCGETRISNKRQSWVTAIQVYEYFISHHLAKAFESVFGGVTCLPGCFSMYRLKVRKAGDDDWVPLLAKPEIIREYSQSDVQTLHQKNLLLLGEDRFLTTCLIRTFPNRKMMFCPQARCRTVAPDSFSVLLSQRRRWINSTIHNLMELVRVRNLCGTFCFSMQFVVFMDLLGTTVLPVAIALTYVLVVTLALNPPRTFEEAIPLMLLLAVIGLPAVLILLTTRKIVYVFWMFAYLLALPVWNFVLPVYSFWHFDDFSWGETRKVEGEGKGDDHGGGGEAIDTTVPLRRWEDWERSRLRKLKREERRRREMERQFPGGLQTADGEFLRAPRFESMYEGSDTASIVSSDEDHWGGQIGGYNENASQFPPPPVGLSIGTTDVQGETLGKDELAAMLEVGWDDKPSVKGRQPMSPTTPQSPFRSPPPGRRSLNGPRSQLSDAAPAAQYDPYVPLQRQFTSSSHASSGISNETRSPTSGTTYKDGTTSAVGHDYRTHAKKRSGSSAPGARNDGYGPLGPLDPGDDILSPQRNRF